MFKIRSCVHFQNPACEAVYFMFIGANIHVTLKSFQKQKYNGIDVLGTHCIM